jgi:hypothetical protein
VIAPSDANDVENGKGLDAVNPPDVTVIGSYVALTGMVAVSEVEEDAVTAPKTLPKYRMLFEGVELKLVPVIVMLEPRYPDNGATPVIVGICEYPVSVIQSNVKYKKRCLGAIRFHYSVVREINVSKFAPQFHLHGVVKYDKQGG